MSVSTHIQSKLCITEVANFGFILGIDWPIDYRPINQKKKALTLLLMCMSIFTKCFERKFEVSISLSLFPNFTASHHAQISRNELYTGRENENNEAVSSHSFFPSSFLLFPLFLYFLCSFYFYLLPSTIPSFFLCFPIFPPFKEKPRSRSGT